MCSLWQNQRFDDKPPGFSSDLSGGGINAASGECQGQSCFGSGHCVKRARHHNIKALNLCMENEGNSKRIMKEKQETGLALKRLTSSACVLFLSLYFAEV